MKIDVKALKKYCDMKISDFSPLGDTISNPLGNLVFIPSKKKDSKVLAVAHLDTVRQEKRFNVNGPLIFNPKLDNRLGVYIILDLLKKNGLDDAYDILLTDCEEQGDSTAQFFTTSKEYNWMFSFDRRGKDVVTYQYHNAKMLKALEGSRFEIGQGSFSDICFLDHIGTSGMNIGNGCKKEHDLNCYVNTKVTLSQVQKFIKFFSKNMNTRFPYSGEKYIYNWRQDYKSSSYNDVRSFTSFNSFNLVRFCSVCGFEKNDIVDNICQDCWEHLF